MVKPIFKAAANIRTAESADEAFQVALLFLSSREATNADPSQAGTFLADVKTAFDAHNAPDRYKMLLNMTRSLKNSSEHLKDSADRALATQLAKETKQAYEAESTPILLKNAQILSGVKAMQTQGRDGAYIQTGTDTPDNPCVEINAARDATHLKEAINNMMLEQPDVSDADAKGFMHTLDVAFRRTNATPNEQLEMLDMITNYCSKDDKLYDLTIQKSMELIDVMEGRAPRAVSPAPVRGHNFTME